MAGRKLKVFQAQFGVFDTVVAAPSRAAALRAWGARQNLFASGDASVATDEGAIAAAVPHPETPLRRAVGSKDAFALEPKSLPKVPKAPAEKPPKPPKPPVSSAPPRTPPDRAALDAAERALSRLEEHRKTEEAELRRQADVLEAKREEAQKAYLEARKSAAATLAEARSAYRTAGGEA